MIRTTTLLLAAALVLTGCAPVVVSDVITKDRAKSRFVRQIDAANFARRTQHLPELDPCSEKFWYDRAWALSEEPCASQVRRWEGGDTTALNPVGIVRAGFRPTVPPEEQAVYDRRWQRQRDSVWVHRAP